MNTREQLSGLSNAELITEVARREKEKEAAEPPELRTGPVNSSPLLNACKHHFHQVRHGTGGEDITKEDVYKAAMEHAYGGSIHEWIRKHI